MRKVRSAFQKTSNIERGITLIALVITMVILIILATVTISATFGENGLLKQAEKTKDIATNSISKENEDLNRLEQEYANMMAGDGEIPEPPKDTTGPTVTITTGTITENSIQVTVNAVDNESGLATEGTYKYYLNGTEQKTDMANSYTFTGLTAKTQYTIKVEAYDKANNKGENSITASTTKPMPPDGVPLPDGFYYVGGSKAEGVVISDNAADEGKGTDHNIAQYVLQGNQFVWIPVEDDSKFTRYEGYSNGSKQSYLTSCSEPYASGYAAEQSEFDAMKASVKNNKGFYVGRYETGTNSKRTSNTGITDEAIIKQGKNVYNYIKWGNSMTDEKGGAVEKAKNFAKEHNYSSVTSTLVYGVEWDAIMNFIDSAYETGSCKANSFVANSTGKGWYDQSAPTTTGSNANYAVKNIYDLGGNVREWTMEASYTNNRVYRGRLLRHFRFLLSGVWS